MSRLRSISKGIWTDPFIEKLTPVEKLLFIYLLSNEKTNMLGIYELSVKKISFETGISEKEVIKALNVFSENGKVFYEKNYVIIKNFLKHQRFNTNMKKSALNTFNSLPDHIKDEEVILSISDTIESFEILKNLCRTLPKIEVEYEAESEYELESKTELENRISIEYESNSKIETRKDRSNQDITSVDCENESQFYKKCISCIESALYDSDLTDIEKMNLHKQYSTVAKLISKQEFSSKNEEMEEFEKFKDQFQRAIS